jgi:LacI family transcriptional regulator
MPTQSEIARDAGCSTATVSRALAGDPRISYATRARIEEVAVRLGYFDRAYRYSTKKGQSGVIGLVVPTISPTTRYEDASLLHDLLAHEGYRIMLCVNHQSAAEDGRLLRSLILQPVDGIIHVPCTPDGAETHYKGDLPVPVIELGARTSSKVLDTVSLDDSNAVSEIVNHLVRLNHRRIAMFTGPQELYQVQSCAEAFSWATNHYGLRKRECQTLFGAPSVQWARKEAMNLLDSPQRPTAMIAANNTSAIGILLAAKELGAAIPRDLSVVGFSEEDWHAITETPLTSYEHPVSEMGMMAAQLLLRRLRPAPGEDEEPRTVRFGGRLIQRGSTAPPGLAD